MRGGHPFQPNAQDAHEALREKGYAYSDIQVR